MPSMDIRVATVEVDAALRAEVERLKGQLKAMTVDRDRHASRCRTLEGRLEMIGDVLALDETHPD